MCYYDVSTVLDFMFHQYTKARMADVWIFVGPPLALRVFENKGQVFSGGVELCTFTHRLTFTSSVV